MEKICRCKVDFPVDGKPEPAQICPRCGGQRPASIRSACADFSDEYARAAYEILAETGRLPPSGAR